MFRKEQPALVIHPIRFEMIPRWSERSRERGPVALILTLGLLIY